MKLLKVLMIYIGAIWGFGAWAAETPKIDCKDLDCLRGQMERCHGDLDRCARIFAEATDLARACKPLKRMGVLLDTVKVLGANSEADDYFSKALETLFLEKPECVLDGLAHADSATRRAVIHRLENPHALPDAKADVLAKVRKYKARKKYSVLFKKPAS